MDEELKQSEKIERYGNNTREVLSSSTAALPEKVLPDDPSVITADIVSNLVESLDSQNDSSVVIISSKDSFTSQLSRIEDGPTMWLPFRQETRDAPNVPSRKQITS